MTDSLPGTNEEQFIADLNAAKEALSELKEEVKGEVAAPESTAVIEAPEAQLTDVEKEAVKQGWNPNHQGPNKKTAEQFLHDGSFFKKIDSQNKKIDDLTQTVKLLLDHNKKLEAVKFEEGYKKALVERNKAVEEGDVQAFNVAEEKLKQQVELHRPLAQEVTKEPDISADDQALLKSFQSENKSWFGNSDKESQEMTKLAIAYDQYNLQNGMSYKESLKEVESIIKYKFPHRFSNPNQDKPAAVLKSEPASSGKAVGLAGKMTEQQRWMFNQAKVVDPSLDINTYAKQLKEIGALRDE